MSCPSLRAIKFVRNSKYIDCDTPTWKFIEKCIGVFCDKEIIPIDDDGLLGNVAMYLYRAVTGLYTSGKLEEMGVVYLDVKKKDLVSKDTRQFGYKYIHPKKNCKSYRDIPDDTFIFSIDVVDHDTVIEESLPRDGLTALGKDWDDLISKPCCERQYVSVVTENKFIGSLTRCNTCGIGGKLKRCSQCSTARYCSVACQRANWKEHTPVCISVPPHT